MLSRSVLDVLHEQAPSLTKKLFYGTVTQPVDASRIDLAHFCR